MAKESLRNEVFINHAVSGLRSLKLILGIVLRGNLDEGRFGQCHPVPILFNLIKSFFRCSALEFPFIPPIYIAYWGRFLL